MPPKGDRIGGDAQHHLGVKQDVVLLLRCVYAYSSSSSSSSPSPGDQTGDHGSSREIKREITGDQTGGHGRSREQDIAHHSAQTVCFHLFWFPWIYKRPPSPIQLSPRARPFGLEWSLPLVRSPRLLGGLFLGSRRCVRRASSERRWQESRKS